MSYVEQSRRYGGAPVHSRTQERLRHRNENQERLGISATSSPADAGEWLGGWMDGWLIRLKRLLYKMRAITAYVGF